MVTRRLETTMQIIRAMTAIDNRTTTMIIAINVSVCTNNYLANYKLIFGRINGVIYHSHVSRNILRFVKKRSSQKSQATSLPTNQNNLKVYSSKLFLFQLTNDLCTSFTKLIIILFLSKAVFIKKNFVISILIFLTGVHL